MAAFLPSLPTMRIQVTSGASEEAMYVLQEGRLWSRILPELAAGHSTASCVASSCTSEARP